MNLFNKVFSNDTICRRKPQKSSIDDHKNSSNKSTEFLTNSLFIENLQELYEYAGKISFGPENSPLMIIEDTFESPEYTINLEFLQEEFMNNSIGINFHNIYRASLFAPKVSSLELHENILKNHIKLINPKILLVIGSECLKSLRNDSENSKDFSLLKIHGTLMNYNGIPMFPTFHPSYVRRSEKNKLLFRKDLHILKEFLNNNSILI